ncbi:MAG: SDR family NAD(P)-dependent oxidoreductase [Nitrospirae bacterium]|nr:MAG: SDR family NAD(P)-dependent oxidoreductase [Nitrospirota bacterium]
MTRGAGIRSESRPLAGQVALITGAGRGIGRATAELFAQAGARLVLCARTKRQLDATLKSIVAGGGEAVARVADIGLARQGRALAGLAKRRYGRLDILINNAGILGPLAPLVAYPLREWSKVLRVNLTGTFIVTQQAARLMAAQGRGCIVTISSSVGRAGRANWGGYAVSKFGGEGMSQILADELRTRGVIAFTFNPGGTKTDMRARAYPREDRRRLHTPSEAAQVLLRLVASATPAMSGKAFDFSDRS